MGSIQVFPRRPTAAPPAPSMRGGPRRAATPRVREARLEDFAAIRGLQRLGAAHAPAMTLRQFESRRSAFAEGQMVAQADGEIVGWASSLLLRWDDYGIDHTWKEVTGEGTFTTHTPAGGTLYGAELFVDEDRGGFAAARALIQARQRLCRRRNLCRVLATVRLREYREYALDLAPERYVMRVIWGDIPDPWLRFHMAQGLQHCGVVRGYLPEDEGAGGHAALLAWLNPLHSPLGPPARIQPRKCA